MAEQGEADASKVFDELPCLSTQVEMMQPEIPWTVRTLACNTSCAMIIGTVALSSADNKLLSSGLPAFNAWMLRCLRN